MDVRLLISALSAVFFLFYGCGNHFDINSEHGRQAMMEEANLHLNRNECNQALASIQPLLNQNPDASIDEDLMIIEASAYACLAGYNTLHLLVNFSSISNNYAALAKTVPNTLGDGAIAALYTASDILSQNGVKLKASQRGIKINNLMTFIQMGIIGAILNAYGKPDSTTNEPTKALGYTGVPTTGNLADEDACALAAAHSIGLDSFKASDLSSNTSVKKSADSLDSSCAAIPGITKCSDMNQNRSLCSASGSPQTQAASLITHINSTW